VVGASAAIMWPSSLTPKPNQFIFVPKCTSDKILAKNGKNPSADTRNTAEMYCLRCTNGQKHGERRAKDISSSRGLKMSRKLLECISTVQYTPPTTTRRNCRDASCRRCEHTRRQSWLSLQFPVLSTDKWRHNDVIVEKIVKIHEHYTTQQIRMFTNIDMLRHILLL